MERPGKSSVKTPVLKSMVTAKVAYAEVTISDTSPLVGELLRHAAFRTRFNVRCGRSAPEMIATG